MPRVMENIPIEPKDGCLFWLEMRNGSRESRTPVCLCICAMLSHVFITGSEKYGRSRESERGRNWRVSERNQSAHFNRHISLVSRRSLISFSRWKTPSPLLSLPGCITDCSDSLGSLLERWHCRLTFKKIIKIRPGRVECKLSIPQMKNKQGK